MYCDHATIIENENALDFEVVLLSSVLGLTQQDDDQVMVQATTVFFEVTVCILVMKRSTWEKDAIKFVVS